MVINVQTNMERNYCGYRNRSEFIPPSSTIKELDYDNCSFPELDLSAYGNITTLVIRYHKLKLTKLLLPPNLKCLILKCTPFETVDLPLSLSTLLVEKCADNLNILHLENLTNLNYTNQSCELPELPPNLKELHCSYCKFTRLPVLPTKLNMLFCFDCKLEALPELPSSLQYLRIHNNPIKTLPALPVGLKCLDIQGCGLTHLPRSLPKQLDELDVRDNNLTSIPDLPNTVDFLNICDNPIDYYPYIYRANVRVYYDLNELSQAFKYSAFVLNGVKVFTPLHLLERSDEDQGIHMYMSDMFDDDDANESLLRRLHVMCEIQNQVLCRAFIKTIKEELMMRTWHPSRIEEWCGVDFMSCED